MNGKRPTRKKLRASRRVESDRDQALHYPGATKLSGPEEARGLNDGKNKARKKLRELYLMERWANALVSTPR